MRGEQESLSLWEKNTAKPDFTPLRKAVEADVCIVGAGIAGLTTGYLLAKQGKSVVIIDAWGVAAGETGRTTAHLTAVLDDRFFRLEALFGEENSRLAAESHKAAIDCIEAIIAEEKINCDFERVDGYLVALDDQQRHDFDKEQEAVRRVGFADMGVHDRLPMPNTNLVAPTMHFPRQATFHILKYMTGLTDAFQRLGGQVFTGSHVSEVKGGKAAYVKTDEGHVVKASHILIATNTPINDWVKMHTKQAAYRTYVVGFEVPKNSYAGFLLWDMQDPYHYARIVRDEACDWLIVGGEDHKTGQAYDMKERYRALEEWTARHFSTLGPVRYRWSGQVMEPVDSLAFIGRNPMDQDNVYIATGDSGNGMTHGTIAGMLITDLIMERENAWAKLYDPTRKTLKAAPDFLKENTNFIGHMVKDWVKPGEVDTVDDIRPGEGAILRKGASKIAVYRDVQGALHERSAVCTHLGCIVQWNTGEKSWDCPCHGSRFDCEGRILNGPAVAPLSALEKNSARSSRAG